MNFDWYFTEVYSYLCNLQYSSIGSDNGLVPTRRQAIICTNGDYCTDGYMRNPTLMSKICCNALKTSSVHISLEGLNELLIGQNCCHHFWLASGVWKINQLTEKHPGLQLKETGDSCLAVSLTHWGRVTHICVSKITNIGSDNGLAPSRFIIWTNAGILLIGYFGTNFS